MRFLPSLLSPGLIGLTDANIPVVGKHANIFHQTGRSAPDSAFSPDYEPLKRTSWLQRSCISDLPLASEHILVLVERLTGPFNELSPVCSVHFATGRD